MRALFLLLASTIAASPTAEAASFVWPSFVAGTPCTGSLQSCIDQTTAGDTVIIGADELSNPDAYTAINEPINVTRGITLTAAPGIDAVFGVGRGITVNLATGISHQLQISKLSLSGARVLVFNAGGTAGTVIRITEMRVLDLPDVITQGCGIEVQSFAGAISPQVIVGDNFLRGNRSNAVRASGICVTNDDSVATRQVDVFRNRIEAGLGLISFGIIVNGSSTGNLRVSANHLTGPRIDVGIRSQRIAGNANARIIIDNNVITRQDQILGAAISTEFAGEVQLINNTLVYNRVGVRGSGSGSTVRIHNNLVAYHSVIGLDLPGATVINSHNAVFANAAMNWTPGPNTISIDPQIENPLLLRLRNVSPLISAGDNAVLPAASLFDAAGDARTVLATVDIGAFEHNADLVGVLEANASNIAGNEVFIDHLRGGLTLGDRIVASPVAMGWLSPDALLGLQQNIGVYNSGGPSVWSVFHQDNSINMSTGQRYAVYVPVTGAQSSSHDTSASSITGASSVIDFSALNNQSARIAIATQNWLGSYHNFPIGMEYLGNRWRLRNEDGSAMSVGKRFNVIVAPFLSPIALNVNVGAIPARSVIIDHPQLNDQRCASVLVGRVDDPAIAGSVLNVVPFAASFQEASGSQAAGHWVISSLTSANFPANAAFNVILQGADLQRCAASQYEYVFAGGFE